MIVATAGLHRCAAWEYRSGCSRGGLSPGTCTQCTNKAQDTYYTCAMESGVCSRGPNSALPLFARHAPSPAPLPPSHLPPPPFTSPPPHEAAHFARRRWVRVPEDQRVRLDGVRHVRRPVPSGSRRHDCQRRPAQLRQGNGPSERQPRHMRGVRLAGAARALRQPFVSDLERQQRHLQPRARPVPAGLRAGQRRQRGRRCHGGQLHKLQLWLWHRQVPQRLRTRWRQPRSRHRPGQVRRLLEVPPIGVPLELRGVRLRPVQHVPRCAQTPSRVHLVQPHHACASPACPPADPALL